MGVKGKNIVIEICALVLAALFFYTGVSKILDADNTYYSLRNQVFSDWMVYLIYYLLPPIELLTAVLLILPRFRKTGLKVSLILMVLFTGYIGIVMTGVFGRVPCSCGGVIAKLTWMQHLIFNIIILIITVTGFFLQNQRESLFNPKTISQDNKSIP